MLPLLLLLPSCCCSYKDYKKDEDINVIFPSVAFYICMHFFVASSTPLILAMLELPLFLLVLILLLLLLLYFS